MVYSPKKICKLCGSKEHSFSECSEHGYGGKIEVKVHEVVKYKHTNKFCQNDDILERIISWLNRI